MTSRSCSSYLLAILFLFSMYIPEMAQRTIRYDVGGPFPVNPNFSACEINFLFFHILGMSSFQLTNSYFSEGFFLNHQPTIFPLVKLTISVGPKLLSPGRALRLRSLRCPACCVQCSPWPAWPRRSPWIHWMEPWSGSNTTATGLRMARNGRILWGDWEADEADGGFYEFLT